MTNNETLHDRAISNLTAAKFMINLGMYEEFYYNLAGYLLQQATELELNHRLEMIGSKYVHTHTIEDLLDRFSKLTGYHNADLKLYASLLTTWEVKSRYIKNYFIKEKSVQKVLLIVESFILGTVEEVKAG